MVPTKLSDWNYNAVEELAQKGHLETDTFEFKYRIRSRDPDYNRSIVRTACAFANTSGGFIVFGIHDLGNGRVEIEGIERSDDLAKEFGDKVKLVDPTIYFEFLNPPIDVPGTNKVLFVVQISASVERPHMTEDGRFYYRTNEGNRIMNYEQIKEAFLRYEERKHKLRLLYLELLSNLSIAGRMVIPDDKIDKTYSLLYFDTTVISDLLPDVYSIIQNDSELMRLLLELRIELGAINSKIRMFHSQTVLPLSGFETLTKSHNQYIHDQVNSLVSPFITKIIEILESKYGLTNPFKAPSGMP